MSGLETAIAGALADSPLALASAYLYGSQAEGRAHRESDVDVGILLARSGAGTAQDRFEARVALTSLLIERLHTDGIDVVILNEAPPLLGRRIVTGGRRVLCNDAEGFRNVLIHEYVALDMERVIDALDELDPIERFCAIVSGIAAESPQSPG